MVKGLDRGQTPESEAILELQTAIRSITNGKNRYFAVFQSIIDPAFVVNNDMVIQEVNNSFETFFDINVVDVVGKECKEVIACNLCDICPLDSAMQNASKFSDFELLLEVNGESKTVVFSGSFLENFSGKQSGGVGIFSDITEKSLTRIALQRRSHELTERVKELNCLYGISQIVDDESKSLKEILQEIVDILPPSWQYPKITCARLVIDDQEYKTENYEKTRWRQASNILSENKHIGTLEIFYLEERIAIDEGPFLKEERSLIDSVTERIGKIVQRIKTNEEKQRLQNELEKTLAKVIDGFVPICANCKKIKLDEDNWEEIEVYISKKSDAAFSHGICPKCSQELYPDEFDDDVP